jgi:hypothetical protein
LSPLAPVLAAAFPRDAMREKVLRASLLTPVLGSAFAGRLSGRRSCRLCSSLTGI